LRSGISLDVGRVKRCGYYLKDGFHDKNKQNNREKKCPVERFQSSDKKTFYGNDEKGDSN
jgi:hypothetical protein